MPTLFFLHPTHTLVGGVAIAAAILKQMRQALLDRPPVGFCFADVPNMSPEQLRRALASVCPGLWTNEAIEAMQEDDLRQQLQKRLRKGGRYFDEFDIAGMRVQQLRAAIRNDHPGLFTEAQFDFLSSARLRKTLSERRTLGIWEEVCCFRFSRMSVRAFRELL